MSSATWFDASVLAVHHWTDRLFSFTTTRDPAFRFQSAGVETGRLCHDIGLAEGNMSRPGHYVIERAFVDK